MNLNVLNNFVERFFAKKAAKLGSKKGFTLAELMIVLAVLAVIAAVLMPTVFNSMPDENKLKFKKGYYTLKRTIDQMVNSDEYSGTEGNFGKILTDDDNNCPFEGGGTVDDPDCKAYFCIQFSEMLNSTATQCEVFKNSAGEVTQRFDTIDISGEAPGEDGTITPSKLDTKCSGFPNKELTDVNVATQDGIYWSLPQESFSGNSSTNQAKTLTNIYSKIPAYYAVICMDVDGYGGEEAFAFGIRRDGKVIAGARAKAWLKEGTTTTVPTPEDD